MRITRDPTGVIGIDLSAQCVSTGLGCFLTEDGRLNLQFVKPLGVDHRIIWGFRPSKSPSSFRIHQLFFEKPHSKSRKHRR
jgi:hypothetical protein